MHRRAAWIVVATTLMSVLFAVVTTSGGVQMWGDPQWEPTPIDPSGNRRESPETADREPLDFERPTDEPIELPDWVGAVARVALVAAVIVGVIAALRAGWRNRPRVRWRRRFAGADDFEALPDIAAAIVDEAEAQRATLLTGEARNAIVRCWLQLEADVAAAGLARPPADTSAEFTERVLGHYSVDSGAIRELGALYREARFSTHDLDDGVRERALDALERLHDGLRAYDETNGAASHDVEVAATGAMR